MSDPLEVILREFAERIREAVKAEVVESLLADSGGLVRKRRARSPERPTKSKNGGKRDPSNLADLADGILMLLKAAPGQRIDTIAKGMSITSKELALPMRKLLAEKKITKKGVRRGTTYYLWK